MKPQLLHRVGYTVQQISSIESRRRVGLYKSISASAGKKRRGEGRGDGNGQKVKLKIPLYFKDCPRLLLQGAELHSCSQHALSLCRNKLTAVKKRRVRGRRKRKRKTRA